MSGGGSLTRRLVAAQALVIAVMGLTMVATAALVAPRVFHQHLRQAGHGDQPGVLAHAEAAYRAAGLATLGAGTTIALGGAVLASVLLTRIIGARLDALAAGAERVARGVYDQPVPETGGTGELDAVTHTFNAMAARIGETETTRRRMLTDLSHEIRTPIAAIEVTLEAVEDGVRELDAGTMATLREQTRRLARLATDIRDVSAAEEGRLELRPERVDLADLVRAALRSATPTADRDGVALLPELPDRPVPVVADPARLGQVLDNLVRNAIQHTAAGGAVTATVATTPTRARVTVTDTGSGIAAEHLPHVFERFYRVDTDRPRQEQPGTGVGLAISRAIARAHDGDLGAASDGPGRGARFTLTLPRA